MPLLTLVWIALLNALALAAPPPLEGAGDRPSRVAGAQALHTVGEAGGLAHSNAAPAVEYWAPRSGDEGLRAPAPLPLRVVGRTDPRPDALRSLHGLAVPARAEFRVLPASRRLAAVSDASHAAAARGGHLPYFPTAPPLQG